MNEITRQRFYSYVTKTRFLHLEDSLEIGKIRLYVGEYRRGHGATATAHHYLDLNDARVLFSDMAWGKAVEFTDYKGSSNGSQPQSRVLKIRHKADKAGEYRYWLEIQNGPGTVMGQGAIKPAGDPTAQVSIPFPIWDARRLAHAALAYIQAWEASNLHALVIKQPDSPEVATDSPSTSAASVTTEPPAVETKDLATSPAGVTKQSPDPLACPTCGRDWRYRNPHCHDHRSPQRIALATDSPSTSAAGVTTEPSAVATDQAGAPPAGVTTEPPAAATSEPHNLSRQAAIELYTIRIAQAIERGVPLETIDEITRLGVNGPGGWDIATQALTTALNATLGTEPSRYAGGRLGLIERVETLRANPTVKLLAQHPEPLWKWLWTQEQIIEYGQQLKALAA